MSQSVLVTAEHSKHLPILIIDKEGSIGLALYEQLKTFLQVVLVGGREPVSADNLLYLSFTKHIAEIPEDQYSHIFFITESEKEYTDFFPACLQKASTDKAKLFLITSQHGLPSALFEPVVANNMEVTILVTGDIFGTPFPTEISSIEKVFYQAKAKRYVKLAHMGLTKVYPISFADVLIEIFRIAFSGAIHARVYIIHQEHAVTELGVVHALQKIDPLLRIDFTQESLVQPVVFTGGTYLIPTTYPVFEKVQEAYQAYKLGKQEEAVAETRDELFIVNKPVPIERKPFAKKFFLVSLLTFILTMLLLPALVTGGAGLVAIQSLYIAKSALGKGSLEQTKQASSVATTLFALAAAANKPLAFELGVVGQTTSAAWLAEQITAGQITAQGVVTLIDSTTTVKTILSGKQVTANITLTDAVNSVEQAVISLEKVATNPEIPGNIRKDLLTKFADSAVMTNTLEALPSLVGMNGKRTYLILFQNNTELRPGGGFIGSYGLVTFVNGNISSFVIHDVYDADGQLKAHIEPPFAIRRYLPSVHFYLRDSNFDPDFSKDAFQAALLLQQETGQSVDGVIGIDLSLVKNLLAATGSIYVPQYNETVTADNFFLLTENHAEKNFFPGSTQKKDFLASLFDALKTKIMTNTAGYAAIAANMLTSATQKHILFAFADRPTQDLFTVNGLSSTLWDPRSASADTIMDYTGVSEANLGINKVNYYVTRDMSQHVAIDDVGNLSGQVTLSITNTSTSSVWPQGAYKNYLRFLLPANTSLVKVTVDGQDQTTIPAVTSPAIYESKLFVPQSELEIERTEEQGKALYGFLVGIPPQTKKIITITYVSLQKVDVTQPHFAYLLHVYKQPGTDVYPFSLSVTFPTSYTLLASPNTVIDAQGHAVYTTQLATDTDISISLAKK